MVDAVRQAESALGDGKLDLDEKALKTVFLQEAYMQARISKR